MTAENEEWSRGQFTFFASFYRAVRRIRKKADRCDAYDAICLYALCGEEPDLDALSDAAAIAFELVRPNLDTSRRKASSGKKGGSKSEASGKQDQSEPEASGKGEEPAREKEKEIEIENENEIENECLLDANASCGEPETPASPPVIALPLNDGEEYPIFEAQCREWSSLYPSVDVTQQLRSMRGWLLSNPTKRKTRRGVEKFVNGWLAKEQDRGTYPVRQETPRGATGALGEAELEAIRAVMRGG